MKCTYCLKDEAKQAALEKVFPGFGIKLNEAVNKGCGILRFYVGVRDDWALSIPRQAVRLLFLYDSGDWNHYPEVQPPEGVLMRVECKGGRKTCAKYHVFDDGGFWCDPNGAAWPRAYSEDVRRFRPWE